MAFADLNSVRMQYSETGVGPERVLFVHGFQSSGRIWEPVQQRLPPRLRTIAVYNRGAGETTAPPDESDFSCQHFADDLYQLAGALGWTRFTLVGHSMGGATAMQFAIDHPQLLAGLVLLDPAPPDGLLPDGTDVDTAVDDRMLRRAAQRQAAGSDLGPDAAEHGEAFLRALEADIDAAPERRLRGSFRSMATLRIGSRLRSLPMPVLLMGGDADELVPLASMLDTYSKLPPGSGLQIWHGIGHSPNLGCTDDFCRVLLRFIDRTIPARASAVRP